GAEDPEGPRVPAGAAEEPRGDGAQVELVRGRRRRPRLRARQGCADAQDRQTAFLRRLDLPGVARLLWRLEDQRQGAGTRHARRGHPRPLETVSQLTGRAEKEFVREAKT